MAQRYKERADSNEVQRQMNLVNGFTFPEMPVITNIGMELKKWGLIPFWSKDDKIRQYTLNARAETIFEKPSFKNRIMSQRCLVPANGYFEWKQERTRKQPYFIHMKNQESFSFAGLWDVWTNKATGEIISTYSIITTEANPFLATIHNTKKRMPVMLASDMEFSWIEGELSKMEIMDFFEPVDETKVEAFPVKPFDLNNKDINPVLTPL